MIELVIFIIFSSVFFFLSCVSVTIFFISLLFISTSFLGLISYESMGPFTAENLIFSAAIGSMFTSFFDLKKNNVNTIKLILFPLYMLLLFIYGCFISVYSDYSTLFLTFVEGKQILIYVLLIYFIMNNSRINIVQVKSFMVFFGCLLSLYVILAYTTGWYPPGYLAVDPNKGISFTNNIHIQHPMYISLALFICIIDDKKSFLTYFCIPLLLVGLILQSHDSIKIISIASIVLFFYKNSHISINTKKIILVFGLIVLVYLIFFVMSNSSWISIFNKIINGESSLSSRMIINEYRFEYILNNLFVGYGFVHQDSSLGLYFGSNARGLHDLRLATIDSGIIDLIVRFGLVNSVVAILLFLFFTYQNYKLCDDKEKIYVIYMGMFVLCLFTWSMLTYLHGIFTMICVIVLIADKSRC